MPTDHTPTVTVTLPRAAVEAARSARDAECAAQARKGVVDVGYHARVVLAATFAQRHARVLADAVLASLDSAPAPTTVDAACACAIERRAVAERCAVGRCAYALREALDLPRDESGDEYRTWEAALDVVRARLAQVAPAADALAMVAAERAHQVSAYDYTPDHDDEHTGGEIAWAAACYAAPEPIFVKDDTTIGVRYRSPFPWGHDARANGNTRVRLLVKAAALIVAEIERLQRAER